MNANPYSRSACRAVLKLSGITRIIQGPETTCKICKEFSHLGHLQSYKRRGTLDIRDHLKIYMGADCDTPFRDAADMYVKMNYPEAGTKAYSLPEGYILSKNKLDFLRKKAREEDVDMPPEDLAVAEVFDKLKHALKDVPSLTVANYAFTDTLLKGINQQQKEKFMRQFEVTEEDLASGDHDVFGVGISGVNVLGLFFQIKATTKINPRGIMDMHAKAIIQLQKDFTIFRTMCGPFLNSTVKLAGFMAFPKLTRLDLQNTIQCQDCAKRILTSEDLENPGNFIQFLDRQEVKVDGSWDEEYKSKVKDTFQKIFTLYVCAASAVDLPRNVTQLQNLIEKHMKPMLVILTPRQKELVQSESKVTFICGSSGTGKTFVLIKKALMFAKKDGVLLINIAGGLLTEEFHRNFKGKTYFLLLKSYFMHVLIFSMSIHSDLRECREYITI